MSDGGAQHRHLSLGETYASFTIDFYAAGTSTDKEVWTAEDKTGSAFRITADTAGIATWYADGDYKMIGLTSVGGSIFTWDNVKMTSDTAILWEGNFGISLPTATEANRNQLFALMDVSSVFLGLYINSGDPPAFTPAFVLTPNSVDTLQIVSNAINADKIQTDAVGLNELGDYHGALVAKTTSQSIPDATFTTLLFDTESYDTDDIHSVISDIGALKVPTIGSTNVSRVRLQANVRFDTGSFIYSILQFYKNNAVYTYAGMTASNTNASNPGILNLTSPVLYVTPGDDFHAVVMQTSGGAVDASNYGTWFSMEILR